MEPFKSKIEYLIWLFRLKFKKRSPLRNWIIKSEMKSFNENALFKN